MKKGYLSIIFCFCAFAGFSATWYSDPSVGSNAANVGSWWSAADGTGANPSDFTAPGDTFIMQSAMTCNSDLNIGGYLIISNVRFQGPAGTLTIGRDLTMTGGAIIDEMPPDGDIDLTINLSGNLYVLDSSSFNNTTPENTIIVFSNTSLTILSPQTITWTSTVSGSYTTVTINANCFVQLLTNVTLPSPAANPDIVNGTLVCGNYVLNCTNIFVWPFQLNSGASLYTANPNGIDSSILCEAFSYDPSANYVFNGTAHQATGLLMPNEFVSPGSVTVNNASGVTLSQSTAFDNGSTLALTNGNLTIGGAELNFGVTASLTGPFSATNMIITNGVGMLQKQFSDNGSFLYPVGDTASNYSPISISVSGDDYSGGAYVGANVTPSKDPNNHNATNFLKRYWSVTEVGVISPSYTIDSAKYVLADVVGTEANISMGQFISTLLPWVKFGPANTVQHTLSATAVTNSSSEFTGISTAAPTVSIPHSIALCSGDTAIISVDSVAADTPFTYAWSPSTSLSSTTGSSVMTSTTSNITYTVTVTDANGFTATDTIAITVNAKPTVYTVTGGGPYCSGAGGAHVDLTASDTGILYQLFRNDTATGAPVAGTGSALDLGSETAGTYTVVATNATTGCFNPMFDSAVNTVIPSPVIDTVTGGGSFCSGATGVHIRLTGSTTGISYQLYNGVSTPDTAVTGTGSALDFGIYSDAGTFTVIATNTVNACTSNMADSAKVIVNPLPSVHVVTTAGSGHYCPYAIDSIGLNGSDTGIHYQLYLNDTGARGSAIPGTGSALHFGYDTVTGVYTVVATNATTGCTTNMSEGAAIVIFPVVVPSVSIEPSITNICVGETVTFTATAINGGEPNYQWRRNDTVAGLNSPDYSYIPANGDVVSVRLISSANCAVPDTVTDSMTVTVSPLQVPTITLSAAPGDTVCKGTAIVISAAQTFGGPAPAYAWVKNMVVVSTDSFYSYVPVNDDNIYCVMESDYFCLSTTTAYSNVIDMTVEAPVVPSVSISAFPSTIIHIGKPDTLVAVVTNGGTNPSYQWYVNNTPIGTATSSSFSQTSFLDRDSVSVKVTRRDACNLSNFTSVVLAVNDLDVKQVASSGSDIKLVPNPNRGTFTITGSLGTPGGSDEEVSIEVTDMLGQVVYKSKVMSQNGAINELVQTNNTLANGIYLLNLKSQSGSNTIRFVIGQ